MSVSLDGHTSFIGTEFIKLLNTGTSDLATEEYVDNAVANGGGGGGNVDLSNYYTEAEVDALLNNKLNVNNPQDIIGTLRIDSTNGNGKLIVNAVGAPNDEDFYVNGLSNLGGTLKAQVIQASSNIQTSQQIQSNTINTYSNSNMIIQRNAIPYITLDSQIVDSQTVEKIILMKDVEFSGGLSLNTLSVDTLNTIGLNDMVFNVATLGEFLRFQVSDNTVRVPNTKSFLSQNIFTDIVKPLTFANDISLQGKNTTSDGYEEYVKINSTDETVDFNKEIDVSENIVMKKSKFLYFDEVDKVRYITATERSSPSVQNHIDIVNMNSSQRRIRLLIGNTGSDEQLLVDNTIVSCKRNLRAGAGLETNTIDTVGNANLSIQRNNVEYLRFDTTNDNITCSKEIIAGGGLKCNTLDSDGNSDVIFKRNETEFFKLKSNNIIEVADTIFIHTPRVYTDLIACNTLGTDTVFYGSNTADNQAVEYFRFNHDIERLDFSKSLRLANSLIIDVAEKLTMKPSLEGGVNVFDIRNLHPVADNPMIRFRVGEGAGETIVCEMSNNAVSFQRNVIVGTAYELRTNAIDTTTDNDLVISRNNIPFLTLDKFTEDTVEKEAIICSKQLRANSNILVKKLQINQFSSGVEYADFRLHNADSVMRFYVGNSTNANFQIINAGISLNRETTIGSVKTNTINSNGDNDLVFQRNGTEIFKCETSAGIDNNNIINVSGTGGVSAVNVYGNSFKNRTLTSDTIFYGANSAGDNRVEYMKWNRTDQSLDFNAPIDNTNISIIGNIIDTTVSDERLKTNIQDVESNFTECVKNVKIKTFEYKDEKYKNSDKYGFIAQNLLAHLPKECKNIVKEAKPKKDEGEAYLSINYMKLSLILWGCCQEQQSKIEHLESRLFELEDVVKELKGKGKDETKPKAKAKSKSKAKNVD